MVKPECPYFGRCGGCSTQDLEYEQQLEKKQNQLKEVVQFDDIKVIAGKEYHYRNRMDFVFHSEGLGLRERGFFYKFVGIEQCAISNSRLNQLLTETREFFEDVFYFDVKRRFGAFCYAVIRTPPGDSSVSIVLNKNDKKLDRAVQKIQEFAEITSAENLVVTFIPYNRNVSVSEEFQVLKGHELLEEIYLDHTFHYPLQGFFQVNHDLAEQVHRYCNTLLSSYETKEAHLIDLFAGVGTFGIINADLFKEVTIIENYQPALKAAEMNISQNQAENVKPVELDAKNLRNIELPEPFFLILDPPRSGIHPKTIKRINELKPEALLYVSCNPKHLVNDLAELDTFGIKSAALFDMFPQTPHMEAVVELVPKPS